MDKFLTNAKGLARNPLGIIALFISMIYGFACLVLGISGKSLVHEEKMPLVWFLIFFPVIILLSFLYLVIRHHKKLYAPSDFRDDSGFLFTIDSKNIDERLEAKTNELTVELIQDNSFQNIDNIEKQERELKEEINSRNSETNEDLKKKYLMIENLVFSDLESEFKAPILRSVAGNHFYFDGMVDLSKEVIGVEVKYTKLGHLGNEIVLRRAIRNLVDVKRVFSPKNVRFMLIVVHECKNLEILNKDIKRIKESTNNQIEFRIYNYNDTINKYGLKSL